MPYAFLLYLCVKKIQFKIVVLSQKKSFVLRIDSDTYKALEKWAADEFRSVNGQIEFILHQKLLETKRLKQENKQNKQQKDK